MRYRKLYFADDDSDKTQNPDIPDDDGHQMSQNEIDDLIAKLLNQ